MNAAEPTSTDSMPNRRGLIISLDFELMWGLCDLTNSGDYLPAVLGVRQAVPAMLAMFAKYDIHATWATVGLLLHDNRKDLMASLPDIRPSYNESRLSPYLRLDEIGTCESSDPFHYGLSLADAIMQVDGQEIGSHTFCHYYCLEPGQTTQQFHADAMAAQETITRVSGPASSLVFPRNQFNKEYLAATAASGIRVIRGNERHWSYAASDASGNSALKRGLRLLDSYVDVTGNNAAATRNSSALVDIPSSRFLRPFNSRLGKLESIRCSRITSAMESAFVENNGFHLWWHPHNFGTHLQSNMAILESILKAYAVLRDRFDAPSYTMTEYADMIGVESGANSSDIAA